MKACGPRLLKINMHFLSSLLIWVRGYWNRRFRYELNWFWKVDKSGLLWGCNICWVAPKGSIRSLLGSANVAAPQPLVAMKPSFAKVATIRYLSFSQDFSFFNLGKIKHWQVYRNTGTANILNNFLEVWRKKLVKSGLGRLRGYIRRRQRWEKVVP